jgi:DNA-binding NtrC family response regulator
MTRVLIVDDDRDHAESLADIIEMRGHQTEIADTGEDAIACFRESDFDFVLLDVKLPGINGVDAFLEMKKIRPTARAMMMTGYSVGELVVRAVEGGALGVLHKPFSAIQVLEILAQVPKHAKVLVVDDDPDFVDGIVPILESAGYTVEVAANGPEALERIVRGEIDCLLLDLRLPVMSGAELHARLVEAGCTVPTILVTGSRDEAEDNPELRSQLCGMLFKPFEPNALLTAIGSAVSVKGGV